MEREGNCKITYNSDDEIGHHDEDTGEWVHDGWL